MQHAMRKKNLLVAFDAFGTLFKPRAPIASQYGEVARRHGLSGFTDDDIQGAFKNAFKEESRKHPNYGKEENLGASAWWGHVITKTFQQNVPRGQQLPPQLVPDLLKRFSTSEGYSLYPDVQTFFDRLRQIKQAKTQDPQWPWEHTVVGVITNSDDRIPGILHSFDLKVGERRAGTLQSRPSSSSDDEDISFVVLSYDVGCEKPDRQIFDAAKELVDGFFPEDFDTVYIGDDVQKDVFGAEDAGWHAICVSRNEHPKLNDTTGIIKAPAESLDWTLEEPLAQRSIHIVNDLKKLTDSKDASLQQLIAGSI